jgi:hypothetical protein
MVTHHPLTIAELEKKQVQVLQRNEIGQIHAYEPAENPRGMGVSGLLQSDIFGLDSTLDKFTQDKLQRRNYLIVKSLKNEITMSEKQELEEVQKFLEELGFIHESRDPLYQLFIEKMYDAKSLSLDKLFTKAELIEQDQLAEKILLAMVKDEKKASLEELAKQYDVDNKV